jgi:hypothetical protein
MSKATPVVIAVRLAELAPAAAFGFAGEAGWSVAGALET